jgi:uncharacterized protein (TIGR03435 family)
VTKLIGLLCASALLAQGQVFDAASVKPADPQPMGMIRIGMNGGPGTPDPGRINYTNVSLKMILTNAFNVKDFQINGPAFLDSERFDIVAKLPKGSTKEDLQVMLQNLLAERFKMTFHKDKKEMNTYVLLVGKNGPKLKVADPEPPADPNTPEGAQGPPARPLNAPVRITMGKDGFPEMPKGMGGRGGRPMMMMMPGRAMMFCTRCPISSLADTLGNQLGKPVVDMTELKGEYEFKLAFEPDMGEMGRKGMMMAGPPPGRGPGGGDGPISPPPNDEPAPPLLSAIQDQLGLRLESKKAPVDLIVIDHIEKVATDN